MMRRLPLLLVLLLSFSLMFGLLLVRPAWAQEAVEWGDVEKEVEVGEVEISEEGVWEPTGETHTDTVTVFAPEAGGGRYIGVDGSRTSNANQDFGQGVLTNIGYVSNNTSQSTVDWINSASSRGEQVHRASQCGCWRSTFGDSGGDGGGDSGGDGGGTGKIQGLKVVNADPSVEPPRSQKVEVTGTGKSSTSNPFFLNDIPSGTRTFTVTVPGGWTVRYTGCYNGVKQCHHPENGVDRPQIQGTGSSVNVNVRRDQYLDWRWHFSQVCDSNVVGNNRLIGCLFDGTDFNVGDGDAPAGPALSSPVPDTSTALDQDWGRDNEVNSFVGKDTFSARWKGNFTFKAGTYTFYAGADDGVRLKIDGGTKVDDWVHTSYRERSAAVTLTAGVHLVELEYFEKGGNARASLRWTYTSDADLDLLNDAASELQFYAEPARTTPKQSFTPNQTIYARIKTRNGGTGAINAPFRVGFYLNRTTGGSPPCNQTPDPSNAFRQLNSLSAGATDTWDFEVQAPSEGGTKIAYAFADYQCAVAETNETNNIRSKTYAVIVNAWFETQGGDAASTGLISVSQQPPSGRYQSSYLLAGQSIDPKVQISPTAYRLSSYSQPLVPAGGVYTYMAERFRQRAIDEGEQRCNITAGSLPGGKKYGYCLGDADFNSGNGPNGDQIWFIDGNLTIKKDLTLGAGDLAIFIVKGNITVNTDVKRSDGIYVADGIFTDTTDVAAIFGPQLVITGGVYGRTVSLARKLGGSSCAPTCDNTLEPAEKVVFDPKYLARMSPILGSPSVSWLEVNP